VVTVDLIPTVVETKLAEAGLGSVAGIAIRLDPAGVDSCGIWPGM
jgi:hypothetical protein